jgi:integrase/recombinase XerD
MIQDAKEAVRGNWNREIGPEDLKPAVKRYRRYLKDKGLRESTIPMYVLHASKYLEFSGTDSPSADDFARFRDHLLDMKLSWSTINNYSFSIRKYHEMLGQNIRFKFIKPNNTIPYYFDETEIARIFGVCMNVKHLAMLKTIFYDSLRATELCKKLGRLGYRSKSTNSLCALW